MLHGEQIRNSNDELLTFSYSAELLGVDLPQSYKKETWQMDENVRLDALPKLRLEGNELYQNKKNDEASKIYAQAKGIIEQLQLK